MFFFIKKKSQPFKNRFHYSHINRFIEVLTYHLLHVFKVCNLISFDRQIHL